MQPVPAPQLRFLASAILAAVTLIGLGLWLHSLPASEPLVHEAQAAAYDSGPDAGVASDDMHAGVALEDFPKASLVQIYEKVGGCWFPACDATVIRRAPGTYTYDLLVTADCVTDRYCKFAAYDPDAREYGHSIRIRCGGVREPAFMHAEIVDLTANYAILRADIALALYGFFDDQTK